MALLRIHDALCLAIIRLLLRAAVAVDEHRRRLPERVRRWRATVRGLYRRWLRSRGVFDTFVPRGRRPWNRTPDDREREVVRLHVEQPRLGAGQLRWLAARVLGFHAARETVRRILIRRRELVVEMEQARRRRARRIRVSGPRQLWGCDLTLVLVLGFVPVWLVGIVDYHGSRLLALERVRRPWPTAAEVVRIVDATIRRMGPPDRLLTDRGSVFTGFGFASLMADHGVRHVLTFPAHPWTNGRIERLFRTFKETVFGLVWLVTSIAQLDRFCTDFVRFYNDARPHSSWGGLTPAEVARGDVAPRRAVGRVTYFDGRLRWYRFG